MPEAVIVATVRTPIGRARASARDHQPWRSASHPEQSNAPAWDMSITGGENNRYGAGGGLGCVSMCASGGMGSAPALEV